ncbi:bifunctional DNA primase/polymerase [Mycobacterium sp. P7213]|uniref:bifunctional DNA primase/polymerase n=1 Tax=Mycobacterium sp. P7213 TaxID=2478465 RepID=UPI0013DD9E02|nr:bifunctional DNA primase/polymerase [Mycobacterium sp. P7213]
MTQSNPKGGNAAEADRARLLTALLADAPDDATGHEAVRKYVHRLAEAGLAVLFVWPGSKVPADMRSPQRRSADDKAARAAAKVAGRRGWDTVKSPAGLALATTDTDVLDGYLDRYVKTFADRYPEGVPVSLAVEVGGSELVVVDCDTAVQMQRWRDIATEDIAPGTLPTVISPGQLGPDGVTRVHSDGGHWWFTVPDGVRLPAGPGCGALTDGDDGFAVLWDRRYVLVPPSVREEGSYATAGEVRELPPWLAEAITDHGRARVERAERGRAVTSGNTVERWGASATWAEILAPTGWSPTGKVDGCGCETWTAPGAHASAKSATAHEPGCGRMDTPDPGLNIWTDHDIEPFGPVVAKHGSYVTRLRAVAATHYDNDLEAAMDALNDAYDGLALTDDDVVFLDSYRKDVPPEVDEIDTDDADDDDEAPTLTLSREFWSRHPRLQLFHDMCLSHTTAPDAALGFALVRLAAHTPPDVRVSTGVRFSLPLNMFAFATSTTGAGKTTAANAAEELVVFRLGWGDDPMACPVKTGDDDAAFPALGSLKTGEGLVEAYYGERTITIGTNKNGSPKTKTVRSVVRSNLLTTNDEGRTVVTQINDEKASLGATLREMWSGSTVGASLADRGRDRLLRRGTYSLGVVIGTQQSVLGDLVTRTNIDEGTVQRFLMVWSKPGPYVTAELLAAVAGEYAPLEVKVPTMPLRLCAPLREQIKRTNTETFLAQDAGPGTDPDEHSLAGLDSQRTAMVAKLAALLAVFLGAGDDPTASLDPDDPAYLAVGELEWQLAEELFAVSCAIATDAATRRRARRAKTARAERAVARAEHVADVEARTTPQGRARAKLIGALTGMGRVRWSGKKGLRNRMFNGNKEAAAELDRMIESGQVSRATEGPTVWVELLHQ